MISRSKVVDSYQKQVPYSTGTDKEIRKALLQTDRWLLSSITKGCGAGTT
ncbi:predicted protein [Coccidioides posadasii str. Silveira]|uniref:Predicted protein n=1 Tax=Coccidioides posadasii (strain RMSCC 757 / Silveira) TaxID=443226 RepID=E9D881_COCPS|nr:predicted protein [Coccidioides posadasii str. Silveira]